MMCKAFYLLSITAESKRGLGTVQLNKVKLYPNIFCCSGSVIYSCICKLRLHPPALQYKNVTTKSYLISQTNCSCQNIFSLVKCKCCMVHIFATYSISLIKYLHLSANMNHLRDTYLIFLLKLKPAK